MLHQALLLDRLGGGEDVLIGFRRLDAGLFENVLAEEEMLRIAHEGDRHHLAVDLDQLVRLQILAIFGDEVVERAHQAVIEQGHDGIVGDDRDRILGRIDL